MSQSLKRWLGIVMILLLTSFSMGIVFPWIISTNTLPLSIIVILVIIFLTCGIAVTWHIIKYALIGKRALKVIMKQLKDMESKK